jgi:hypothetical protein
MDYSGSKVTLPECHIVKRKDMKLFCFFLDVFIAGLRSATVVPNSEQHTHWRAEKMPLEGFVDLESCKFEEFANRFLAY